MNRYRLKSLEIDELWGWRRVNIHFDPKVNILIGRNGCGKTSILNLVRHTIAGDLRRLSHMHFGEVKLLLESFDGSRTKTLRVRQTDDELHVSISRSTTKFSLERLQSDRQTPRLHHELAEVVGQLAVLVPNVWLPVSRRLDVSPASEEYDPRQRRIESVDERLRHLLSRLQRYRLRLESLLANEYKQFERDVLRLLLYDKSVDELTGFALEELTDDDREELTQAFKGADLYDSRVQRSIDNHFKRTAEAVSELREKKGVSIEHVMLIPLMKRTKSIIALSRTLEKDKTELFAPLRQFESIVNSYIAPKQISVNDEGELSIVPERGTNSNPLTPDHLSSGEKQILILLVQALLNERRPVVYIADEPELSLHVEWQSKLISSILALADEVQLVVATHSPDIVADFDDNLIKLDAMQ